MSQWQALAMLAMDKHGRPKRQALLQMSQPQPLQLKLTRQRPPLTSVPHRFLRNL